MGNTGFPKPAIQFPLQICKSPQEKLAGYLAQQYAEGLQKFQA